MLFSIPVIHPNFHIYSVVLFSDVEIQITDVIIFLKISKSKISYFPLVTDDVIKVFDDINIF